MLSVETLRADGFQQPTPNMNIYMSIQEYARDVLICRHESHRRPRQVEERP